MMMILIEIEDGKPTERSARSRSSADTEYFLVSYRFPFYIALRLWEWWLWWGWWFSLNMFGLQLPSKLEHYKKLWEERCNLCPLESCKSPFLPARQDGVKWSNTKKHRYFLYLVEVTKIVLLGPFLICQVLLERCQMSEAETRIPSETEICLVYSSFYTYGEGIFTKRTEIWLQGHSSTI